MKRRVERGIIVVGPLLIVVLWYVLPKLGVVKEFFLPSPLRVSRVFLTLFIQDGVSIDIAHTLFRTALGFFFAALWGLPAGLLLGYYAKLYTMFEVVIDFFRSLPATALIPLALVVFASGEIARVFVVLIACGLVLVINSAYGVRGCNTTRLQVARIMRASTVQEFYTVILNESLPQIFAGLRISLSLSLILVVVSEMFIGTRTGLGLRIYDAQLMNHIAEMYALVLITGLLGYALNKLFVFFENRTIHWAAER